MIGPSGSGKTTALRAVAGFVRPVGGRIRIGGADVTDLPPYARGLAWWCRTTRCFRTCAWSTTSPSACTRAAPPSPSSRRASPMPEGRRHDAIRPALSARAFRRPAAARRDRPRARGAAEGAAARRAALGARRADPPLDGRGDRAAARRTARPHRSLRHPRPERGADARRPHRHHQGRGAQRSWPDGRPLSPAAQPFRGGVPRPRQPAAGRRRVERRRERLRRRTGGGRSANRSRRRRAHRLGARCSVRPAAERHSRSRRSAHAIGSSERCARSTGRAN